MTGQGKSAIDTLLAESFKELALKQPIEKITIKEITDKAGVIRPTFYNHFQDKYDLLEWIRQAGWKDRIHSAALHKAVWSACCYRSSKDRQRAEKAGTCG